MHDTIKRMHKMILERRKEEFPEILAEDVAFRPPTYWAEWRGRGPVAALLGHVSDIFQDFEYHRMWEDGPNYALEFYTKVGDLNAVGIDMLRLNEDGLIEDFEVVMRPVKTVAALRQEMEARVMADERFLEFAKALE